MSYPSPILQDLTVRGAVAGTFTGGPLAQAAATALIALGAGWFVPPGAAITLAIGTDVASLDAALTGIASWTIPNTASVTIVLPSGATARTAPVVVNHPYGSRIKITGAAPVTTTASAAGAVTGSAGAWAVPLTLASAAGIAVGDYALVKSVVGTGQCLLFSGIARVAAIAGTQVTVTNVAQNAAWPTAALTSAAVTVLKSRLTFAGCDGFDIDGPLGSIDQLALVGDRTAGTIGLIAQRTSSASRGKAHVFVGPSTGITRFGDGQIYAMYGGSVLAPGVCVADGITYNALAQQGGSVLFDGGISTGGLGGSGGGGGIAASSGGSMSAEGAISVGCASYGFYAFQSGALLAQLSYAQSNVSDGLRVAWGGSIRGTTINSQYNGGNGVFSIGGDIVITGSITSNNGVAGLYAEGGGSIYAADTTSSFNASYGCYADGATIDAPGVVASANGITGFHATDNGTILAAGAGGAANGTYLCSASRRGFIRATTMATLGAILNADSGGVIDATGALQSPVFSYGAEGLIIGAATTRGSVLLASTANLAIGATNTAAFNIDRASNVFARFARSGTLGGMVGLDDGGSLIVGAAAGDMVIRASATLRFGDGSGNQRGFIDATGSASLGRPSLATNATDGFLYIPSCAGTPTGIPTAKTGLVAVVADTTNNKFCAFLGGAWVPMN